VGCGPAERQTLGKPKFEFLVTGEPYRNAKAHHSWLANAGERRELSQAALKDTGGVREHQIGDFGLRFAQAKPSRAHPFERAARRTPYCGFQLILPYFSEVPRHLRMN
jgi:hypothetical protein